MNSILEAIAHHAQNTPWKVLIADAASELTAEQIWNSISAFAQELGREGIKKGDRVLVECTQDSRYLISILSVQLAGGISVPLEKKSLPQRIMEIADETDSVFFINKTSYDLPLKQLPMDSVCTDSPKGSDPFKLPASDETAEILFSTGTTGKSKGIEISHGNIIAVAENIIGGVDMTPNDTELIPMPLSHSHGLRTCYANLLCGSTLVLIDGVMMVSRFFQMMEQYHVTGLDLSPSALQVLQKLTKDRLGAYQDQLKYIEIGTAPLSEKQKEWLTGILPHTHLYNFYGTTEGGRTCIMDFSVYRDRPSCIGKPTRNARFIIVDENREPMISSSVENTGFLAYYGKMNMKGYWRQPELTESIMRDGVIYSNDVGYIDEAGFVYMLGRNDDVINFNGIKISPEEIESAALTCEGIADCACIPIPDVVSGQKPKLFVVMEPDALFDLKKFSKEIRTKVDQNKVPSTVEVIDEIPRTPNGKILRRVLRDANK